MISDNQSEVSAITDQTVAGKITAELALADVVVSPEDREVLRSLASHVAEIAAGPRMAEVRKLWKDHNTLRTTRPVIFCDPENGWHEIITEADLKCRGKLARQWEMELRKNIFWGDEMGDDKPVEPHFTVSYTVTEDDWGLKAVYHTTDLADGAKSWDAPICDYEKDLPKLHPPQFEIDFDTTSAGYELAREVFAGIMDVRLQGFWWWSLGLTWPLVKLRGLQNLMMDFWDHPDELKELLSILSHGLRTKLDYLESRGLLHLNNDGTYVGSGGFGFTDELPAADFDGTVRCRDMWGFAESQETVGVSPEMYEEFIFPYEQPLLSRFGLNCYGCCEPVHSRWHVIKRHHNLRRVSCSPWTDLEKMAEYMGGGYIMSVKPNPSALAVPDIDHESIREELRRIFEVTKGCVVEVIMKDNHTIAHRPQNVIDWCRIAREEAIRVYERD